MTLGEIDTTRKIPAAHNPNGAPLAGDAISLVRNRGY
jgi:hypothetical protein